ncbi:MAG: TetR/AcrR family transcriptional regulator [Acidimicrobiaceae bacterium]|jgi:AcrR family transcriptional regulator
MAGVDNKAVHKERKLGRPADTDSTDTRDRIVRCAQEIFAAEGFEGTTNKDIAARAEISSAALYHYFPSKAEMYVAVCESITCVFVDVFSHATSSDPRLERRLTALFSEVGTLGASSPSIVGFITGISAVVKRHPEVARGTEAFGLEFRKMTLQLIETSTESERILQGVTPASFADLTASILAGLGRLSARGDQARHLAAGDAFLRLIRAAARN